MSKWPVKFSWVTIVILISYWLFCASFYPSLPEQVPTHWNIRGEVDDYSHKAIAALVMPLLPLGIYILMTITPKIDPKKQNYHKFSSAYEKIMMAIVVIMMGITFITLVNALGYNVNVSLFVRVTIPLFFIFMGNYLGKVRFNYFMGIRVPWTLANEEVWNKTHRLGGKLMVVGGLISLLSVFTPPTAGFIIMMAGIFLPLITSVIYSYFLYSKKSYQ